ncbi:MAG: ECF-type sigma factor [Pyrinomonadaceae bacterium]
MTSEVTDLLIKWSDGDQTALEALAPLVEVELRRLAHHFMGGERPGHILDTMGLVNEAYLRLVKQNRVRWQNRAHFFGIAGQMMRRILSNYARDQRRLRRGGGALRVSLSEVALVTHARLEEVLAIDEALARLAAYDPPDGERMCQVVEMRFFGGLSVEEVAEVLRVSVSTVNRDWKFAKGWLARAIGGGAPETDA